MRIGRVLAGAIVGLAGIALAGVASLPVPATGADLGSAKEAPAALVSASTVSRDEVVNYVRQLTAIVPRADRVEAKLTSWADFIDHEGSTDAPAIERSTPVWVVAASGDLMPSSARQNYPWGVFVFNASTGRTIAMLANDTTPWPPYFDALGDVSR